MASSRNSLKSDSLTGVTEPEVCTDEAGFKESAAALHPFKSVEQQKTCLAMVQRAAARHGGPGRAALAEVMPQRDTPGTA